MISAEELKGRLPTCDAVARDLYGIEFRRNVARCPFPTNHSNGDRDPSLRYDPRKERIFCASQQCFGEKGVDAFGLVQRMEPCDFPTALSILQDRYGPFNGTGTHHSGRTLTKPPRRILAETVREGLARESFRVAGEFSYTDDLRKVRFEHETETQDGKGRPKKTFRWEHFADGHWWSGDGGKEKPLYANRIFRERDQLGTVLAVEGEAKADLAGELGLPAFSFREEVSPQQAANLADCDVILWADNDSASTKLALARAEVLAQHGLARSISIIEPPGELPESGDIVDAVRSLGWDRQRIENLLHGARPYSAKSTNSAPTELAAESVATHPREQKTTHPPGDFAQRITPGNRHDEMLGFARRVRPACKTYEEFPAALVGWGSKRCTLPIERAECVRQARDLYSRLKVDRGGDHVHACQRDQT